MVTVLARARSAEDLSAPGGVSFHEYLFYSDFQYFKMVFSFELVDLFKT